jgi:Fe-S-cluster containining protein
LFCAAVSAANNPIQHAATNSNLETVLAVNASRKPVSPWSPFANRSFANRFSGNRFSANRRIASLNDEFFIRAYTVILKPCFPPATSSSFRSSTPPLPTPPAAPAPCSSAVPGCTQCCIGVFPISQLDAARLRTGLIALDATDPQRAATVRERAQQSTARLTPEFPGDPYTGILDETRPDLEDFANDEPCPALDPATGLCDLYAARPMTCRVFGPPLRVEDGLGVCELCYHGATESEIAACEVHLDTDDLESALTTEAEQTANRSGNTIVAFALIL